MVRNVASSHHDDFHFNPMQPAMNERMRTSAGIVPRTWLGRLLSLLVAGTLAIAGFFFLMFALIAAAIIAACVIARLWWISRKLRAQRDAGVIEGTYSVETESRRRIDPPDSR
jgi:hypothetical protein